MSDMLSLLNSFSPRRAICHQPFAGTSPGLSALAPGYFCSSRFASTSRPVDWLSLVLVTPAPYPVTVPACRRLKRRRRDGRSGTRGRGQISGHSPSRDFATGVACGTPVHAPAPLAPVHQVFGGALLPRRSRCGLAEIGLPRGIADVGSAHDPGRTAWCVRLGAQVPALLLGRSVALDVVAPDAAGPQVAPAVAPATAARQDVVDGRGVPAAVRAAMPVTTQHAAAADGNGPPLGRADVSGEEDDRGSGQGQRASDDGVAPVRDHGGLAGEDEHEGPAERHDGERFVPGVEHQRAHGQSPLSFGTLTWLVASRPVGGGVPDDSCRRGGRPFRRKQEVPGPGRPKAPPREGSDAFTAERSDTWWNRTGMCGRPTSYRVAHGPS